MIVRIGLSPIWEKKIVRKGYIFETDNQINMLINIL